MRPSSYRIRDLMEVSMQRAPTAYELLKLKIDGTISGRLRVGEPFFRPHFLPRPPFFRSNLPQPDCPLCERGDPC